MLHELNEKDLSAVIYPTQKDDTVNIAKYLKEIEREIQKTHKELDNSLQLSRLESMLRNYNGEDRLVSSFDLAEKIKLAPPERKIITNIGRLDDILGGFRNKQLIVIAAPTKNGKTSFCIDLTSRMKEYNPTWLPFEEPAEELIQKFLDRNEQPPFFYTPERMTGNTLLWMEKKIIEAKVKYGSEIIFIDHLHFIVSFSSERPDLVIGQTMRDLKKIAKQWNVIIFLIAHLKKTQLVSAPSLEDLRDSSFIAQEADTVIMLWRKTNKEAGEYIITDETIVSVQANRRTGKTGNITLKFKDGKFLEVDEHHEDNVRRLASKKTDDDWEGASSWGK
jgi:replicative DNA helicase